MVDAPLQFLEKYQHQSFVLFFSMNSFFVWLPFILNAFMTSVVAGQKDLTICEMIRLTHSLNSTATIEVDDCWHLSSAPQLQPLLDPECYHVHGVPVSHL
ncbi:hypothetical protein HF086_018333 [Spodoptera exigua]|uniref:Uncharacterized protein n=1 Tax=Spodoptera exigua TaxID=7107 RepID=A0A922M1Q7_SPOEX|nr:hypothetical protein HF086_018333 [Spodoptera exigua]